MIGYVEGTVRGDVVVTVSGVGYRVDTPTNLTDGSTVALWVETVVRDNDIKLFGFTDPTSRDVFRNLCKVPGIGPAAALAVLRELTVAELAAAINHNDIDTISRARGVGRKAAQSIVTNVKLPATITIDTTHTGPRTVVNELITTLTALGYPAGVAEHAATRAVTDLPDSDEPTVLARALLLAATPVDVAPADMATAASPAVPTTAGAA